jgi:acid phosphatase family membrane protein YuiD
MLHSNSLASLKAFRRFGGAPISSIIDSTFRAKKSGIDSIAFTFLLIVLRDNEMIRKKIKTVILKIIRSRKKSEYRID